jgi:DNA-binding beta-propeller fold protein YncE
VAMNRVTYQEGLFVVMIKSLSKLSALLVALMLLASWAVVGSARAALSPVAASPIGQAGTGAGQFHDPSGVAVNTDSGDVYVADTANNRIQRFDKQGSFISTWGWGVDDGSAALQTCTSGCEAGIAGSDDGQLSNPVGVAVNSATGDVYVVDVDNGRTVRYSATGTYLGSFSSPTSPIAVAPDGNVYLADNGRTAVFDAAGLPLPDFPGHRSLVGGLAFDSAGNLVMSDIAAPDDHGVFTFDTSGALVRSFARETFPSAMTVDPGSDAIFAAFGDGSVGASLQQFSATGELTVRSFGADESAYVRALAYNPKSAFAGAGAGALFAVDQRGNRLIVLGAVPAAPQIVSTTAMRPRSGGAVLAATIDPSFRATTYRFDYGASTTYGHSLPTAPGGALGPDGIGHEVTVDVSGLEPSTRYHYRVIATNALGTTTSADRTFTTASDHSALVLPNGRAWEQATPVDKNESELQNEDSIGSGPPASIASPSGDAVAYGVAGSYPGADSNTRFSIFMSLRLPTSWETIGLNPPRDPPAVLATQDVLRVSEDLSHALVSSTRVLAPGAQAGATNVYREDTAARTYQLVLILANPDEFEGSWFFRGGSRDFGRLLLQSNQQLTPGASAGVTHLYEWSQAAGLRQADVLPDGSSGPGTNRIDTPYMRYPVSRDGSRILFQAYPSNELYLRIDGTTTIPVSVSQRAGDPDTPVGVRDFKLSHDGSTVIFSAACSPSGGNCPLLTEDARADREDYYSYDVATGHLTNLTAGIDAGSPTDPQGPAGEVYAVSDDGSTVYFGLTGQAGAVVSASTPGRLYVLRHGAVHRIDDALSPGVLQASPDGRYILVSTGRRLTDDDNGGYAQVYRYDADARRWLCVSCRPDGTRSQASAKPNGQSGSLGSTDRMRNVLDNGRVFFESRDALVPEDVNGKQDVYQWEDGRTSLISSGQSTTDSFFGDASVTGDDVYFSTREQLVGQDTDGYVDMYDARVGGGFDAQDGAGTAVAPCAADACQGALPAPTAPVVAASVTFAGPFDAVGPVRRPAAKVRATRAGSAKGSRATLRVKVPSAGRISASGPGLVTIRRTIAKAQTATLSVRLGAKAARTLRAKGRLSVRIRVAFTPRSGPALTTTVAMTFKAATPKGR